MYTSKIEYLTPPDLSGDIVEIPELKSRIIIDSDNPIYARAKQVFSQRTYMYPSPPVFLGQFSIKPPEEECFVLRLLIKNPMDKFKLPQKLEWTAGFVHNVASYQKDHFPDFRQRYAYLTIRSGPVKSKKDDEFHVDGFQGVSVPRHIPEQSYVWSDVDPTLFAIQPYFLEDLDPSKHNAHLHFQKHTVLQNLYQPVNQAIMLFDPYHIHARPQTRAKKRTIVRLSFSPTEIRDDTNTENPNYYYEKFNKPDPRNYLWAWENVLPELKFGLVKK